MIRYAVLVLSDRASTKQREDRSGAVVKEIIDGALQAECLSVMVLPDERELIEQGLRRLCDEEECDLVLTTGGTGLSPRDVTPEATRAVIDREVPGMADAMRIAGLVHTPHAMLSRGICGLRRRCLIVNLSGSPKAVREQLDVVLPVLSHAVATARGNVETCAR